MSSPEAAPKQSSWSFKIGTVAGISVKIHFTFLLLLIWIAVLAFREESRVFALLLPSIFFCVVLHEFGHALVGRGFGVGTRDITLYPIGGVAMMEKRPKPAQEFWIALAGPLVNVFIAVVLYGIARFGYGRVPSIEAGLLGTNYLDGLFVANLILPAFNMIPAFPMDGGRVLRALLAMKLPALKATQIAASIGQVLAMLFGFWGLLSGNILLVFVAFFVFLGAAQEVQYTMGMSLLAGRRVSEAMMTRFRTLRSDADLKTAARLLLEGSQSSFPVIAGEEVIGMLSRDDIIRGLSEAGPDAYVAGYMSRDFPRRQASEPLETVLDGQPNLPALVYRGEVLAGVLSAENLSEFLMVTRALRHEG